MLLSGCIWRRRLITDLPTTWLGRQAKGLAHTMLGQPSSMRSHISAVRSQPSPMVLQRERISSALAAMSKMSGYGWKRVVSSSMRLMGARKASMALMPAMWVARRLMELPSSPFMLMGLVRPKRKKSTRPGTWASQPSDSMTLTTSLLAVGWNLTRISPTTPTRGLERSLTSGRSSNASMVRWHRR